MVKKLRCQAASKLAAQVRVAGRTAVVVLVFLGGASRTAGGQEDVHYLHQGVMPPGAIGSVQLQRGGPLPGYFQPVEIKAPEGAAISLAVGNQFADATVGRLCVGLLVGQVYRIRVSQIPLAEGVEVFPTIEVIDRLYVPNGQQQRFPIPIELSEEDLRLAASGKFVTRVIYLEDPFRAIPAAQQGDSPGWFDVGPGRDPLAAADEMGRPVAILRMGARVPGAGGETDEAFYYGSPPACRYACPPRVKQLPAPPKAKAKAEAAALVPFPVHESRPRKREALQNPSRDREGAV